MVISDYKVKISCYKRVNEDKAFRCIITFGDEVRFIDKGDVARFERIGQRLYIEKTNEKTLDYKRKMLKVTQAHTNLCQSEVRTVVDLFMNFRGEYDIIHYDKDLDCNYIDLADVHDYTLVRQCSSYKTDSKTIRTELMPSVNYIPAKSKENNDMAYVGDPNTVRKDDRWIRNANGEIVKNDKYEEKCNEKTVEKTPVVEKEAPKCNCAAKKERSTVDKLIDIIVTASDAGNYDVVSKLTDVMIKLLDKED